MIGLFLEEIIIWNIAKTYGSPVVHCFRLYMSIVDMCYFQQNNDSLCILMRHFFRGWFTIKICACVYMNFWSVHEFFRNLTAFLWDFIKTNIESHCHYGSEIGFFCLARAQTTQKIYIKKWDISMLWQSIW